jgi:AcrR family transcriptional regulator
MAAPLTKRQIEVAAAAGPVFLANGYARTTMGAIAAAAGLSRPGLYLIFPHKEAAFTAAVRVLDTRLHDDLENGLATRRTLEDRLAFVCERWVAGIYDRQRTIPQARDMDDLAFPIVREVYQRFTDLIVRLLREGCDPPPAPRTVEALARVLVFGVRGLAATAGDERDMRRLLSLQIAGVICAARQAR